jgi:hypothetical protein
MKTMITAVFFTLIAASTVYATAQVPDRISYDGKEYALHTNPLEPYFFKQPDKRPKGSVTSALWRGYVATFEVKDNSLLLKDIDILVYEEIKDGKGEYKLRSVKDSLVPKGQVLQIDWFTGILVLPYGKLVNYVHMGYGSTYSDYILLEIKSGKLTGERKLDGKQYKAFKERQFQAFKKTEAYKEQVAELKKNGDSQEFIDAFLRDFVVDYTSEFLDEEKNPNKTIDSDKK